MRCPRKHPISTPRPLARQPPSSTELLCSRRYGMRSASSTASHPGQGPLLNSAGRSRVLASSMVSCHNMSPVLFSLPWPRGETLMSPQTLPDPWDEHSAQFPSLMGATNVCQRLHWTGRISGSGDCWSLVCPWCDPGMWALDHRSPASRSISTYSPKPAPHPHPHLPPCCLLLLFDFEYSCFPLTLPRIETRHGGVYLPRSLFLLHKHRSFSTTPA